MTRRRPTALALAQRRAERAYRLALRGAGENSAETLINAELLSDLASTRV